MKIAVIYHSETGNTKRVAELISNDLNTILGITCKAMSIDEIDSDFLHESKSVIFGCPIYAASISWQMKKFFDTCKFKLADKLGGVYTTANFIGGGNDFGELHMISLMLVRGMLIYSGGSAKGRPFTHLGAAMIKDGDDSQKERVKIFARRIVAKAKELFPE